MLFLTQVEQIEFIISNGSDKPIKLDIGGIRTMTLAPGSSTEIRLSIGEKISAIVETKNDGETIKLLLISVSSEISGKEINADKLLKKALKDQD